MSSGRELVGDALASRSGVSLEQALTYAKRQPVLVTGADTQPLVPIAEATQDPAQIEAWFANHHPQGVAWRADNIVVFAVAPAGEAALAKLEQKIGPLPATREQTTPTGGRHLMYRNLDHASIEPAEIVPGVAVISGSKAWVVVAPSRNGQGAYAWVDGKVDLAPLPAAWVAVLGHGGARGPTKGERTPAPRARAIGSEASARERDLMRTSPEWPDPVDPAAYHGLLGEFVALVEPHTEADPVALLTQALVAIGNAIGRRPHVRVEADLHHANLAVVLIGDTSKARKGTSLGHARAITVAADPDWEARITGGLSSGEGLITAVRDKVTVTGDDGEQKVIDEGVTDKRLLVIESELVSVLKVAGREGNTLTAQLRQAWDSGRLSTLTRREPLTATGAHISLIGHITSEELRRYLDATEAANGFGNRLLWICVRRSKLLPEGGQVPDKPLRELGSRLRQAIGYARGRDEITRDAGAKALWAAEYERLSYGRLGLVGALLARGEAQTLRLAMLYALLDRTDQIREEHLRAALAIWNYVERSVTYVFGDATGNPDADTILNALRPNLSSPNSLSSPIAAGGDSVRKTPAGLTRSDINRLFSGHLSMARISRALALLFDKDLAYFETENTGGRPLEHWYAKKAEEARKG